MLIPSLDFSSEQVIWDVGSGVLCTSVKNASGAKNQINEEGYSTSV